MTDHNTHPKTGAREVFLRTIAIVGLIAVLVLGAWGIILLAFNLPTVFSNAGSYLSGAFTNDTTETPTTPVVPTQPTTPTTPVKPTTPSTPSNNTTYTYVPAATQPVQLYGSADLATRIISVNPAQNYYGYGQYNNQTRRYTMQFEISNVGTNVAQNGWNFNTLIPWTPNTYTFTSQSQQALYPGDKIVYTLSFDAYVDGVVCTAQYPNNCQYQNPNYNYQNSTCGYRYNGYTNVWSCGYTDVNGNWVETGANYNNYNQYQYPQQYNRAVTVNADANNWIWELNENNNRATSYLTY